MKLSCLPVSLFGDINNGSMTLEEWVDFAAACGLDGADISVMFLHNHTPTYLSGIKDMIAKKSIPFVMCCTYPDFTHYDAMQLKREMAYCQRDIALCSELGIPYMRVLAGQAHPQTPVQKGVEQAISCLREAAEFADACGVTLVYENHAKPGAWHYIDMTYPLPLFTQVLEGIWDTSIRLNYDIGNVTACGEDAHKLLEKIYPKVDTIHVSDMRTKGEFQPVEIGTGVAPLKETFALLKQKGFDGWLCIEEASFQGKAGIRKVANTVRRMYEEA